MSDIRAETLFLARLAEEAGRWDDMATYITRVAVMPSELNTVERNTLSVAFKYCVQERRSAWLEINKNMKQFSADSPALPKIEGYKLKVEQELAAKCNELLQLIRKDGDGLLATASSSESQVFYMKMEGDYHRYLAQCSSSDQSQHCKNAENAYNRARELAASALPAWSPIRLGTALNFSVFYYELCQNVGKAIELARAAVKDVAADEQRVLNDDQAKDIYELLKENLQLWEGSVGDSVEDL